MTWTWVWGGRENEEQSAEWKARIRQHTRPYGGVWCDLRVMHKCPSEFIVISIDSKLIFGRSCIIFSVVLRLKLAHATKLLNFTEMLWCIAANNTSHLMLELFVRFSVKMHDVCVLQIDMFSWEPTIRLARGKCVMAQRLCDGLRPQINCDPHRITRNWSANSEHKTERIASEWICVSRRSPGTLERCQKVPLINSRHAEAKGILQTNKNHNL